MSTTPALPPAPPPAPTAPIPAPLLAPLEPAGLPRLIRLPRHRTMLRLDAETRLFGIDPATAVLVERLPPALAGMLDALTTTVPPAAAIAAAVRRGADPRQAEALLRRLLAVGAVVAATPGPGPGGAVALVIGDGPLAAGVATGLARAGLAAVHVQAAGVVAAGDVGTGYTDADRGRSRGPALAAAVRRIAPAVRTGPLPQRTRPDVAVLADALVPGARRVGALHAAGVAHVPVRVRDGTGVVGPLVLPGRSPCLTCVDLHRGDRDPAWPRIAALLAGRRGRADAVVVTATAALATAQALAALEVGTANPPAALGATLTIGADTASVARRPWPPHARCPCRGRRPDPVP
ncbi:MAG: TOMM precursor leader peptide-binding protein [Dehalococcoidia bacterium]